MIARLKIALLVLVVVVAGLAGVLLLRPSPESAPLPAPVGTTPPVRVPVAVAAPVGLPVLDYWGAPRGFPADRSTATATEGLHTTTDRPVYDAPGGLPRAFLPAKISGVPLTVPIVERQPGWVAVLLPSVNRRVGWLTTQGWTPRPLHDHLVVHRRDHELTWFRDGAERASWTVATGTASTPTPLGRTFVLGRVPTRGEVYAGLDALALGSVPDRKDALAPSLRDGHTAIHSWYQPDVFGRSASNGCIRIAPAAQETLLRNIGPGTEVTVLD